MNDEPVYQPSKLAVSYKDDLVVRSLTRLIPFGIGSIVDLNVMDRAERIKKERVHTFFEELGKGEIKLTVDLVESNEFIHAFDATMRATLRARNDEKIRMFARLLQNGVVENEKPDFDDYEETVQILEDISFREWSALSILDEMIRQVPSSDKNPLEMVNPVWNSFANRLATELDIPLDETSSFMNRIARTGLYNEITGSYFDYGGGLGMPTPRFNRIRAFVLEAGGCSRRK